MLHSRLRLSRPRTNGAWLVNLKAQALINRMIWIKEEFKEESLYETPRDVKAEVLVETMADTEKKVKAEALI